MLLRSFDIPEVDILIAGHHGSKHSTSEELLAAVSPETVCISAGRNNPFVHPAEELLRRLERFGCTVTRTDLHGTIIFRR
jgi:competence protein ComEC